MRLDISREWCAHMAHLEGDNEIGAGIVARDPAFDGEVVTAESTEGVGVAFGRFVKLMRRSKKLSVEKLAEQADIDLAELINLEENAQYLPALRTVHHLARFFEVQRANLLQIAGLTVTRDNRLVDESVRFAARSEPSASLSPEEQKALEAFVAVLSEQKVEKL